MMIQSTKNELHAGLAKNQLQFEVIMVECCEKKYRKLIKKDKVLQRWTENYLEELQTNPYIGEYGGTG